MKRILSIFIASMFFIGITSSFACPVKDIEKGLKTIVTSPSQLTDHIKAEVNATEFMPLGLVGGALKGSFYMGKEIVDGVWMILAAPYHVIKKL